VSRDAGDPVLAAGSDRPPDAGDAVDVVDAEVAARIDALYREDSRRILATLIRLLGDFDLAEEALQDAFVAAAERWPRDGIPASPRGWLISTGRFKAVDRLRRRARFDAALGELARRLEDAAIDMTTDPTIEDDRLRLLFICCHPALPPDAQVAMALREVCGLTTEEIARAFLTSGPTVAQRIVRAKARIRSDGLRYEVPPPSELPARLEIVLHVIALVFTEGYAASSGPSVTRADLVEEAIRLGRLLADLLPDPEALGLLALMLFQDSRRGSRATADGDLMLLSEQDRSSWDRSRIAEATAILARAVGGGRAGRYTIQAAIAELHAVAPSAAATDWRAIVGLYDLLVRLDPSSVVLLNRAVAIAELDGPEAGLGLILQLTSQGAPLANHHLAWAARADLLRRLGRSEEAAAGYRRARELAVQEPERRFLERRLRETETSSA
jgi:RNA polymerase sigma-70 factor (ECF subfamily)